MRGSLVLFGAGSIGRSFIGQLFARNGYEVVFVDVDTRLVDALNAQGGYEVVVKETGRPDVVIPVTGVRGLHAENRRAVSEAVAGADYTATAVGKAALPRLASVLADGIDKREPDERPLDIILAENARDAGALLRAEVEKVLRRRAPEIGFVETSIGKMVPIMPPIASNPERRGDPLRVFAESYNRLICDRNGFRGPLPEIPELEPVENIRAYVDRKLFIHNLGHAAAAYLGYRKNPGRRYLAESILDTEIREATLSAMRVSAEALSREYPEDLSRESLEEHIEDLIRRFGNRALGDTVYRVGRDLSRKLSRDDRIVGAMLLAAARDVDLDPLAEVYAAALEFRATDPDGGVYPPDKDFHRLLEHAGLEGVLREVSRLDESNPLDRAVIESIRRRFYPSGNTTSAPSEA
jgi:mannitol-1-phosphate 5-dehydrogenase